MPQVIKSFGTRIINANNELTRFIGILGLLCSMTIGIGYVFFLCQSDNYDVKISGNPPVFKFFRQMGFTPGKDIHSIIVSEVSKNGEELKRMWFVSSGPGKSRVETVRFAQLPEGWYVYLKPFPLEAGHLYCLNGRFYFMTDAKGQYTLCSLDEFGHQMVDHRLPVPASRR